MHPGTLLLRGGHVGRYGMVTLLHVTPPPRSRERTEIRSGSTCMKNQCHGHLCTVRHACSMHQACVLYSYR